ncbi:sulfate transport system ATP-binding protein [Enhydrobacter aerosaccus]|uniref:Sulfate transport system ATP-binding protein n=1 Tax=Enhydrobacter aerosaccus TaxID=225324 RepID=A0A1T4QUQ2_9HYPH|nr:sulfate/molybdate ABC transporter ATP-binding protein [Enhydrobacter aerosaccus]SKA07327.1 sulfate transport system ATP-binding protein [Enhydrobacter aerosaccus]
MAVAITAQGLGKVFNGTAAVDRLDLAVEPGELLALLGPSGSGKTTLLRLVAGLEAPDAGRLLFGEEDATRLAARQRRVGFVFQHYALFKHLTVADNIAYGLRVRPRRTRPPEAEIQRRVGELLDLVQLNGLGKRRPAQLSGGQRQRVALARALAVEPRVLLLDEPFGALDAQVRRDLRRWLRDIHERTGHTTLFVTHDQEEALELADRVAILNRGRLEQIGTPDDILDRPATAFVAGFVGEAVRLAVEAAPGTIRIGAQPISIPTGDVSGPAALFIRPRDLLVCDDGPDALSARVIAVRRTGPARRADISFGPGLPAVEVELPATSSVRKGDTLHVRLTAVRLFSSSRRGDDGRQS